MGTKPADVAEQKFHAAANIFPLDDEHLQELADDIKANGLLVPIETLDGEIIDGRRRWLACKLRGVKPSVVAVKTDDPIKYVLSLNLHRRHLTVSQLGMVGDRAREMYDKAAKERLAVGQKAGGKARHSSSEKNSSQSSRAPQSRDQIGGAVGVSGNTIDKARRVREKGIPEVAKAVESGVLSINKADLVARLPKEEQSAALQQALKPRPASPRNAGKGANSKRPAVETEDDLPEGVSRGVGVARANEAIDCLKRIPKNDRLRKRGFQIVTDWIRHNK